MSTFIRGNRELIKAMNRNLLLNVIRREGEISRKDLTEISGLSVGAVSGIVSDLLDIGWILEFGEGDFTGGRRQTLIRLNPKAGYAIGLKVMETRLVIAISSFDGQIIYYDDVVNHHAGDVDTLVNDIALLVTATVAKAELPPDKVLGAGIGLAGVIYPHSGVVHYSPFFGWRDIPLAKLVEEQLQIPVYIENDVNTLTLTEKLFGEGKQYNNFVVITIGRGIGMGIVINGQLYHGSKGGAGELGHMLIAHDTHKVNNTAYSTLEVLASDQSLTAKSDRQADIVELAKRAEAGDQTAQQLLQDSGELLGIGIANVINILSPELIIVSGEGVQAGDFRLKPMFKAMKEYTFNGLLNDVEVIVSPTNDQMWASGAANIVIGKVFASPILQAQISH